MKKFILIGLISILGCAKKIDEPLSESNTQPKIHDIPNIANSIIDKLELENNIISIVKAEKIEAGETTVSEIVKGEYGLYDYRWVNLIEKNRLIENEDFNLVKIENGWYLVVKNIEDQNISIKQAPINNEIINYRQPLSRITVND